ILTLYSSPSLLHTTTTPPISPLSLHDALPIYMQFLTPKIFGNNASFRIQQEVRRYPLNSIFLHHIRLPPFELRNMWPILQSIVIDGFQPGFFLPRPIKRYAKHRKILILKRLICSYDVGIFLATGSAPTCPKVDQYILTPKRR